MSQRKRARTGSFIPTPAQAGSFGRTRGRSYRKATWRKTRRSKNASNEKLAKALGDFMETKHFPMAPVNGDAPNAIQLLANAYSKKYVLGNGIPSVFGHPASWQALDGMAIGQGDGKNQRVGDSVYLKDTKGTVTIDAGVAAAAGDDRPIEFRMIIYRARQRGVMLGSASDPDRSLFMDSSNNVTGDYVSGIDGIDLMNFPVNKDWWTVFADKKFTLGTDPDAFTDPASIKPGNTKYPSTVTIPFNIQHQRKVTYLQGTVNPSDYDGRYMIAIYASSVGRTTPASNWVAHVRGTTEFIDP